MLYVKKKKKDKQKIFKSRDRKRNEKRSDEIYSPVGLGAARLVALDVQLGFGQLGDRIDKGLGDSAAHVEATKLVF